MQGEIAIPDSNRWEDFVWPEWVPERERQLIEDFWRTDWGRGPRQWAENAAASYNDAPALGEHVRMWRIGRSHVVTGRYIHRWNNIGVVVQDDGTAASVCCTDRTTDESIAALQQRKRDHAAELRRKADEAEREAAELEGVRAHA